ncbi:P1 family peptidase [Coralliovum pocilloporae]|uniref:DmpA family aminopeptidase n=1 Tax=Coralliovum pocilloporae TaxID=3066369 RepID=UPI00330733C5
MLDQKRIRDFGVRIGDMRTGERNAISDVAEVTVGHVTLADGPTQTGVTAILPHGGNLFRDKVMAAGHVINGFGKSMGLMQIQEMGTIETPILLTNTLCIGTASDALIRHMLGDNPDIGHTTGTVNPVVCECNDGYLNDIRSNAIEADHVLEAIASASDMFLEGAVGAGRGMSCYKLKGGIGTASRVFELDGAGHTLGALVLSNMGQKRDLTVAGNRIGPLVAARDKDDSLPDVGSIVVVLATDVPLSERQLGRIARRAVVGIGRTGSFIGNGSGELVLAFSTGNRVAHYDEWAQQPMMRLREGDLDLLFRAAVETTEEAILNSMITAESVTGRNGHSRRSLLEFEELL